MGEYYVDGGSNIPVRSWTATNNQAPQMETFSLSEMSTVMLDRKMVPYGFFVSKALWDALSARLHLENGFGLGSAPFDFHGIQTAVDPSLSEAEFDVAFTEDAWRKRLAALSLSTADYSTSGGSQVSPADEA